jgi:hypothetical protein
MVNAKPGMIISGAFPRALCKQEVVSGAHKFMIVKKGFDEYAIGQSILPVLHGHGAVYRGRAGVS